MFLDVLKVFSDVFRMLSIVHRNSLCIFLLPYLIQKHFLNRNIALDDPKEFDDPEVSDGLKVISNESMEFNDPKGISIESMNFDNPKVYGDTSIYDGLVCSEHIVTFMKEKPIFVLTEKDMFKQLKTRRSRKTASKRRSRSQRKCR